MIVWGAVVPPALNIKFPFADRIDSQLKYDEEGSQYMAWMAHSIGPIATTTLQPSCETHEHARRLDPVKWMHRVVEQEHCHTRLPQAKRAGMGQEIAPQY